MSQVEKPAPAPDTPEVVLEQPVPAAAAGSRRYPGSCPQHHIRVIVSRPAFFDNIAFLRESVAPSKICVVLKANAYGHGLAPLVPVAVAAGADYLGICTNPEAAAIRALGFDVPIFRLRMGLPDELEQSVDELDIEEQIGTLEAAEYLAALGRRRVREIPIHIKIDAGMGRSGFFVGEEPLIRRVCGLPGLRVVGILSHFASSDAADLRRTLDSLEAFELLCERLRGVLPDDVLIHTHNSAATVRLPERRHDMVRVGAACFGVRTSQDFVNPRNSAP